MFGIIKKFRILLNRGQKLRVFIILIMMIIGAGLETIGVSLILPLVSAIMNPDIIESNKYVKQICKIFDLHSANTFVVLVIAGLIILFLFKNLFLFFQYYVQNRFVYNNRFAVQRKLVDVYLHRPYEYYLHASTGEIMRVVGSDVNNAFALLTTLLSFSTEAIISVTLVVALFIVDPLITILVASIMGVLMLAIAKVIKPLLRKAGLTFQKNYAASSKWLLQSVSGIKELKVAGKEEFFIGQYAKYGRKSLSAEKRNVVFATIPRLMIEAFSVSGMLAVIAIMIFRGRELTAMIPQLSAFAVAAVRLMPSVNRLSADYNSMSYQEPALDKLLENLQVAEQWERKGAEAEDLRKDKSSVAEKIVEIKSSIELTDITYAYPKSETEVLKNASMKIMVGKSVGIVGTSGAGKTTVVDIVLGLLEPKQGKVLVDGMDIRQDYKGWLSHIGYIPQMIYMLDDTIRANIAFGFSKEETSEEQVWNALKEAKLADFVMGLPEGLDTEIGERGVRLSGGQRQRIGIARALYTDPELLIFDEATSALDNETEAAIMESINNLHGKKTMIIIAHRLTTIEGCDMIYRVSDGEILLEKGKIEIV